MPSIFRQATRQKRRKRSPFHRHRRCCVRSWQLRRRLHRPSSLCARRTSRRPPRASAAPRYTRPLRRWSPRARPREDEFSVQGSTESLKSPANQKQEPQITSVVEAKPTAAPEEQPPQQEPIESESPANQELQISMCEQIADHVDQAIFLIV